jgi:hypothetical protein
LHTVLYTGKCSQSFNHTQSKSKSLVPKPVLAMMRRRIPNAIAVILYEHGRVACWLVWTLCINVSQDMPFFNPFGKLCRQLQRKLTVLCKYPPPSHYQFIISTDKLKWFWLLSENWNKISICTIVNSHNEIITFYR